MISKWLPLDRPGGIGSPEWLRLAAFLTAREKQGAVIFPPAHERLSALEFFSPECTRVVILGQDPYHGPGEAHGLSFSVRSDKRPPSLRNIFKELHLEFGRSRTDNDLSDWARQGVLLLNTAFSVESGSPTSHAKVGWEPIAKELVSFALESAPHCVLILWGAHAATFEGLAAAYGDRHLVLKSPHPSPLSASRGFFGNRHFALANEFLQCNGLAPIDWVGPSA